MSRNREAVRLALPAGHLVGLLSHSGAIGPDLVLFVHGFGSSLQSQKNAAFEEVCANRGWSYACFSFRGHGDSSGTLVDLRGSTLLEDLDHVADYLASRGVHRQFLVGSSMGGWASSWFACRHPQRVGGCVLIAPAFDFLQGRWNRLTQAERSSWEETGLIRVRNESRNCDEDLSIALVQERSQYLPEELARRWSTPALIFHGLHDEIIPFGGSVQLLQHAPPGILELRLFQQGDHRLLAWKDEMAEAAVTFFARLGFQV